MSIETTQNETEKNGGKNQQSILWDNLRWSTFHIIVVTKGKERE